MPFCEPATVTSMPHSSWRRSAAASDEIASAMSSAGCRAASIALRTSSSRVRQPVDVSLWTTHTALILWAVSALSLFSMRLASAPMRQSVGMTSVSRPRRRAMASQSTANWPVSHISTLSPGDSVLVRPASQAPDPGRRIDDDVTWRLEETLDAGQHAAAELPEFKTAMIENSTRHRGQDALRHGRRPRNLQKVAARAAMFSRHYYSPQGSFLFVSARVLVPNRSGYNCLGVPILARSAALFVSARLRHEKKCFFPVNGRDIDSSR